MKYQQHVIIHQPLDKVVELFDNIENMKEWMEGLQSFEHLSGEPGQVGAKSKLVFLMGKRRIEMIETITKRNLPNEFAGTYEAKGVWNSITNSFAAIAPNETKYSSEEEFKFSGFMKIFGFLMPGMFKKQSMKYLIAFKNFAERQDG